MTRISLLGCSALLVALTPDAGAACSTAGFPMVQGPGSAALVVTARPDTMESGPGHVRFMPGEWPDRPEQPHTIYGQVADVERIGGLAARGLDPSVRRVVLVPWGYRADCRTIAWTGSARWVEPGTRGLFTAVLRDRADWAGGLPTFDVFTAYGQPYPQRAQPDRGGESADSLLSIEDYLSLLETLPTADDVDASAARAYQPLFRWARERPGLAPRYPAREMLERARYDLAYERLRSISPPLAGTYRFELRLGSGPPRVFYARTRERATTWWNTRPPRPDGDPDEGADGYYMLSAGALLPDSLPVDCGPSRNMSREGYLAVKAEPEPGTGGHRWRGMIETSLITAQFPADSAVRRFARAEQARSLRRYERGEPGEAPATFVLTPGGAVRVEQTTRLDDGRTLRLSGMRISRTTIAEPK